MILSQSSRMLKLLCDGIRPLRLATMERAENVRCQCHSLRLRLRLRFRLSAEPWFKPLLAGPCLNGRIMRYELTDVEWTAKNTGCDSNAATG
jgi:hypothetical protein